MGSAPRRPEAANLSPSSSFRAAAPRNLANDVTSELIKGLLTGNMRPGDPLPTEGRLATNFNVSRQVIREAMKHMTHLGLVLTRQGKPSQMAPYENWNEFAPEILDARRETGQLDEVLLELLELRRLIEIEAASLAAVRATQSHLEEMRRELTLMDSSLDDPIAYARHDLAFHEAILRGTRNRLLPLLSVQLRPFLEFARELSAKTRAQSLAVTHKTHQAIFDAIETKSPERARAAMADHLSWTANLSFTEYGLRLGADAKG